MQEPKPQVIPQTVNFSPPNVTEVQVEFTDLDEPTELTGEDGTKIMAQTIVRLVDKKGPEQRVLYTSAFDKKFTPEEKRELVTKYAKMFTKPDPRVTAQRAQKKAQLVSMEEYRKKKRKAEKQARKKSRRA